jgi:hypothetical protein
MEPSNRAAPGVALVLVLVLAAALGITACSGPGGAPVPSGSACASTAPKGSGVTAPASTEPTGGLRVAERGFTQVGADRRTVSLGVLLENTSELVAYRTRIRFRVFDAAHGSAVAPRSGELLFQEIPVILPGQRVAAGAWTYVREDQAARPVQVAGFEVEVSATQWWPRDNEVLRFAAISARYQGFVKSTADADSGTINYSVDSAYCRPLAPRGVAAIFRTGDGRLVGGSFDLENSRPRCRAGGSTESIVAFRSVPPGIDDSRTEISPYCDPVPVTGTRGPDRPVN